MLDLPEQNRQGMGFKRWLIIGAVVIVILGLVGGGVYVYTQAMKGKGSSITITSVNTGVSPIVTPTPENTEATPSASPTGAATTLKRSDLKVQVLNGTGVAGAAGKVVSFLTGLGYKNIKTGNADNYDYTETIIRITKAKENYLDLVKKDLSNKYTLGDTETLEATSSFDLVIVSGKQ